MSVVIEQVLTQKFPGDDDDPLDIDLGFSTLNSGDLIVLGVGLGEHRNHTVPSGWTRIINESLIGTYGFMVFTKTATGSETNVVVDLTSPSRAATVALRITGWNAVEVAGTAATGNSVNPDPPSITPSWGAKTGTMFIPMINYSGAAISDVSGYPTNYSNNQTHVSSDDDTSSDGNIAFATRLLSAVSENPDTFTIDNAEEWVAQTIAIEPDASDVTDPTTPEGTTITKANIDENSFDLNFNDAEDETTLDANITYKMFVSNTNDLDTDVSTVETNGTEVASDTGVETLNSGDVSGTFNPGDSLWANIVAYDEAGNGVIYTQVEVTLQAIFGNVDIGGSNTQNVDVVIQTIDESRDPSSVTLVEIATTDVNGDFIMSTEYDRTKTYLLSYVYTNVVDSGTGESGTTTTLTDTDKSWTPDEYIDANQPFYLIGVGGTNDGYEGRITDNDADTLTVERIAGSAFDATSQYEIVQIYVQTQVIIRVE